MLVLFSTKKCIQICLFIFTFQPMLTVSERFADEINKNNGIEAKKKWRVLLIQGRKVTCFIFPRSVVPEGCSHLSGLVSFTDKWPSLLCLLKIMLPWNRISPPFFALSGSFLSRHKILATSASWSYIGYTYIH